MNLKYKDEDFINKRFGRLTCTGPIRHSTDVRGKKFREVLCVCDCGKEKWVKVSCLLRGHTKSCGCLDADNRKRLGEGRHNGTILSTGNLRHGLTKSRLHSIWGNMKSRCTNPNTDNYRYYGGKGVRVCREWFDSFEAFRDWALSNGYGDNLEIDRIDPNGNYEPNNCRWLTHEQNAARVYNTYMMEICGERYTARDWAAMTNHNSSTIISRLESGWAPEDIVTVPDTIKSNNGLKEYRKHYPINPIFDMDKSKVNFY